MGRCIYILETYLISGDTGRLFNMILIDCIFSFRDGSEYGGDSFEGAKLASADFFHADNFNNISLKNSEFSKLNSSLILSCESGNLIDLKRVRFNSRTLSNPYILEEIEGLELSGLKLNGLKMN